MPILNGKTRCFWVFRWKERGFPWKFADIDLCIIYCYDALYTFATTILLCIYNEIEFRGKSVCVFSSCRVCVCVYETNCMTIYVQGGRNALGHPLLILRGYRGSLSLSLSLYKGGTPQSAISFALSLAILYSLFFFSCFNIYRSINLIKKKPRQL